MASFCLFKSQFLLTERIGRVPAPGKALKVGGGELKNLESSQSPRFPLWSSCEEQTSETSENWFSTGQPQGVGLALV